MFQKLFLIFLITACSTTQKTDSTSVSEAKAPASTQPKEFSRGELILGTQLLTKIFDQEMAPIECVPDTEEASLLLRTVRPRMEIVEDDLEAMLDDPKEIDKLVKTCDQSCTCGFVDDLIREHQVSLTKKQRQMLNAKKSDKELNRCLSYAQKTFCSGELYKTLDIEKADFSFEEGP